jgi:hypothetical protein
MNALRASIALEAFSSPKGGNTIPASAVWTMHHCGAADNKKR